MFWGIFVFVFCGFFVVLQYLLQFTDGIQFTMGLFIVHVYLPTWKSTYAGFAGCFFCFHVSSVLSFNDLS